MQHLRFLKQFEWISLNKPPVWEKIDKSVRVLIEKGIFSAEKHQQLLHNFGILSANMNTVKIAENNEKKLSIGQRWVDFFKKCKEQDYNCDALIHLVSYILSIPGKTNYLFTLDINILNFKIGFSCITGANDPAERCFSLVKKMWTND